MKKFQFNVQAKGGSGKSMLTYLQALREQANDRAYFVDFDSSVRTSRQQLKFLQGKTPPRFAVMGLLDSRDKLDRQLLFENLQQLTEKDYNVFYLDFGAPESDQLPALFSRDYTAEEFKQVEEELGVEFTFNVVIAGGAAYEACTNYLEKITALAGGLFDVCMYLNQSTFTGSPQLVEELQAYRVLNAGLITGLRLFGDFDVTTAPHKSILQKSGEGKGMEAYAFVEKIKILKELAKI